MLAAPFCGSPPQDLCLHGSLGISEKADFSPCSPNSPPGGSERASSTTESTGSARPRHPYFFTLPVPLCNDLLTHLLALRFRSLSVPLGWKLLDLIRLARCRERTGPQCPEWRLRAQQIFVKYRGPGGPRGQWPARPVPPAPRHLTPQASRPGNKGTARTPSLEVNTYVWV